MFDNHCLTVLYTVCYKKVKSIAANFLVWLVRFFNLHSLEAFRTSAAANAEAERPEPRRAPAAEPEPAPRRFAWERGERSERQNTQRWGLGVQNGGCYHETFFRTLVLNLFTLHENLFPAS